MSEKQTEKRPTEASRQKVEQRRELLKKVGKFGVCTAPAVLYLVASNNPAFAS